uniref:Uncharacterized protein n=1 Tax=Rhizophora mucronata TaxID=61149 RepID=A0A2P2QI54_RHIMU
MTETIDDSNTLQSSCPEDLGSNFWHYPINQVLFIR